MNKSKLKTIYPHNVERSYTRTINKYIDEMEKVAKSIVKEEIYPLIEKDPLKKDSMRQDLALNEIKKAQQKLAVLFNGIMSDTTIFKETQKFSNSINAVNKNNVAKQLRVRGIDPSDSEPWINKFLKVKAAENASYITTIRDEYLQKVSQSVLRTITSGGSLEEIINDIGKTGDVSRNKAAFIARDQTGSILGQLTAERFKHAGSEAFRWSDSGDERVRDSHHERNGKIFYYKDNPLLPGEDFNCRCVAEFVDDEELAEYEAGLEAETVEENDPLENDLIKKQFDKTNMQVMVGKDNYKQFVENASVLQNEQVSAMMEKLGDQVSFAKVKKGHAYASGSEIHLMPENFTGTGYKPPLQTVYHEFGHAVDSLGMNILTGNDIALNGVMHEKKYRGKTVQIEERVFHASALPEYNLKQLIKDDLWKAINGDLPTIESLGPKPRKKAEKAEWMEKYSHIIDEDADNRIDFVDKYKEYQKEHPKATGALSDMMESDPYFGAFPLGSGHGKSYWNTPGNVETEFFAHMTESVANEESSKIMYEVFPNAAKQWENIVKDILE